MDDTKNVDRPRRLETITVERPRCPKCGGARLLRYRSVRDQGDGTTLAWVRCAAEECGWRFKIIME